MAFYDQHPQHGRQHSWDHAQGPTRSGASSASHGGEESSAFRQQFDEIERAHDNLAKAGTGRTLAISHGRRDSIPLMGQFVGQVPPDRVAPSRHQQSISDHDGMRSSSSSSSLQGFLQNQRFGPSRQTEAESMLQAKRRAAAQRERELRNFHQEQQYIRAQPSAKAERAVSPNATNEQDRRELIARQHRALYGESSSLYDGQPRPASQDARVLASTATSASVSSPMGFDGFIQPSSSSAESGAIVASSGGPAPRSRSNSTSSKAANPAAFAMFDTAHPRTSSSSPIDATCASQGSAVATSSGVGTIGSRPPTLNGHTKRGTPPMPSPLGPGFGFGVDKVVPSSSVERSTPTNSAAPSTGTEKSTGGLGWGSSGGPWGSNKNTLGQASVWG